MNFKTKWAWVYSSEVACLPRMQKSPRLILGATRRESEGWVYAEAPVSEWCYTASSPQEITKHLFRARSGCPVA